MSQNLCLLVSAFLYHRVKFSKALLSIMWSGNEYTKQVQGLQVSLEYYCKFRFKAHKNWYTWPMNLFSVQNYYFICWLNMQNECFNLEYKYFLNSFFAILQLLLTIYHRILEVMLASCKVQWFAKDKRDIHTTTVGMGTVWYSMDPIPSLSSWNSLGNKHIDRYDIPFIRSIRLSVEDI